MDKYTTILAIPEIDETTINGARRLFFTYKEKQIISNCLFDDDIWELNNEIKGFHFNFSFDSYTFKEFGEKLNIREKEFKEYLKTFILYQMGELELTSLQSIIYSIKKVVEAGSPNIDILINTHNSSWIGRISEFFSMIPEEGREKKLSDWMNLCDDVENIINISPNSSKRTLATFESYFRFNDILKQYWEECTNTHEKLFFFPVWMWWNISGILPLRPCEFVVTPRNCLREIDGKYSLSIRRNRIKGSGKTKSYKISSDYEINEYTIPEHLAKEILWYLKETKDFPEPDTHTLFVTGTHYSMWERCTPYTSRYFSYINLRTCLRYFYNIVIEKRYGYHVIYDNKGQVLPDDNCIEYLNLGDTRHIALINMIAEGATPMVAMMLAGHDNPDMSSHYYSNITQLIECRTYRQYKKMIKGNQSYNLSMKSPILPAKKSIPLENGGRCFSEDVANGDYTYCYKILGPAGEVGFCKNCDFYRDDSKAFSDSKEMFIRKIENECQILDEIVKKVRSGKGYPEDITSAIMRLRDCDYSYQKYILETQEENNNAEKKDI